ncbi:MAG TPA: hypothetical protein VM364_03315 [Vicinamibacterales bacterium]|nr:hypothetical protein [Vicinamibacterales bacterium]
MISRLAVLALAALLLAPSVAGAQTITSADIQRLQDDVFQASSEVSRLRSSDPDGAARLQAELDDLRDEVTYLKVRLRKEGSVPRGEYTDVRDRIQMLRSRARGETAERRGAWTGGTTTGGTTTGAAGGATGGVSGGVMSDTRAPRPQSTTGIPAGQEIDVRLQSRLSSATAQVEDRFEATTVVDLYRGNEVLIPAGSVVRGIVRTVDRATRTDRRGEMTIAFDQITIRNRTYPMRGTVTQALQSEGMKGEAGRIGAGAGVGAVIGGILGGVKGALLGVLIGGGGTIAATEGKDVTLEPGTILRVRLDTPPDVR